ncbi:MAG: transporter substrate-binding domain-containing protein, partial [Caldilineaceae bacterium]|nr:transporter substrate-binding domain-containing protein [Caldilineaceae bacterium]
RYPQLQLVAEQQAPLYFGIGIPLGDDQMRDWINITLQAMKEDGTYDRIYRKWFSSEPFALPMWPDMAPGIDMTIAHMDEWVKWVRFSPGIFAGSPEDLHEPITVAATTPASAPVLQPTRLLESATVIPGPTATVTVGLITTNNTVTPALPAAGRPLSILVPTQEPSRVNTVVPVTPTAPAIAPPTSSVTDVTSPTVALSPAPVPPVVAAVQIQFPLTVTVLSTVNINARTRPTTDAPVISLVSGGTSWPALALSEDGEWVQIALPAAVRGWVARRLLMEADQFVDDATSVAAPSVATAQGIPMTPTSQLLFATATTYQITATDSLASIAQQYYGEQRLWTLIYDANRAVIGDDPNVIPIGIEIAIPAKP